MNSTLVQQCIPSEFTNQAEYLTRVVKAFLSADIPIYKSNNPELKSLFTFLGRPLPSESSLRSQVTVIADSEVTRIQNLLHGQQIFLVVDESDIGGKRF